MKLIELGDRFEEYWQTMTLIDRAHRRAGQLIRKQLPEEVRRADLQSPEKPCKMDFELPGIEGVNLTAFGIEDVYPQTFEVEVTRLVHPFELDGDPWPG